MGQICPLGITRDACSSRWIGAVPSRSPVRRDCLYPRIHRGPPGRVPPRHHSFKTHFILSAGTALHFPPGNTSVCFLRSAGRSRTDTVHLAARIPSYHNSISYYRCSPCAQSHSIRCTPRRARWLHRQGEAPPRRPRRRRPVAPPGGRAAKLLARRAPAAGNGAQVRRAERGHDFPRQTPPIAGTLCSSL